MPWRLHLMAKPGRIFEWFAHFNSIGWGLVLALPGDAIKTNSALMGLFYSGWTEVSFAVMLLLSGVVGCMALWVNGHKPYGSPRFRAAAAAGGCFIYAQVAATLWERALVLPYSPTPGLATYTLMTLFCLYACYQSSREAARA